jgi:hypothetical protein
MTENELTLFNRLLNTLDGVVINYYTNFTIGKNNSERYDYAQIGKMVFAKRVIAELIGADINKYLFPGESVFNEEKDDEDDIEDWLHFFKKNQKDLPLTVDVKKFLKKELLTVLSNLSGLNDSDDACLRCASRMLAEVIGEPELNRYRLMMEKELKPLYFKEYSPKDLLEN